MKLRLYKFDNSGDIIGARVWKSFPLINDGIHIPFTRDCYVIIGEDKVVPDKFIVTMPSQKPRIVFVQPLGESVDVDLNKKITEVGVESVCGDNIKELISEKINSTKSYKVLTAVNNVISYFIEKIMEDRR